MEDDKIKDIFKDFDPELSSSFQFMAKLQKNMEAVEIIRRYNAAQKRRNKWAVAIAGACGFAMGVILTLLFPMIVDWISSFKISLPLLNAATMAIDFSYIAWILVAAVSVLTALWVYELASAKLSPKLVQ
ncbi:MAG: hypothetical protein K2L45_10305 [Muribaculaceae bacterium]|nr:hypothetical protein [Muribaculaceae bacterium]MDE6631367.1 hypothetical protein [Muribaculaceae bacterium]